MTQLAFDLPAPPAGDEPLVPARMVNEWVYCKRLAFLEWAHGEWAHSVDTMAGERDHGPSDHGRAPALPEPGDLDDTRLRTRRVTLSSEELGLIAVIDILDVDEGAVVPLDIKTGKRPPVPEGAYLPERVQVCIQGLLLREAGYHCEEGALWFAGSREKVPVPLTDDLVAEALRAASELRLAVAARKIPAPLENSPKCTRCSLLPICLPDEVVSLKKGTVPRTPPPAASSALPLYVQDPGARVRKTGDILVVEPKAGDAVTVPIAEVSELVVAGPVSLTTPAVHALLKDGVPIAWASSGFWFLGTTGGSGPRSAAAPIAQYAGAGDRHRRLVFARALVAAKLLNQRTVLRRNWRQDAPSREKPLARLKMLIRKAETAPEAQTLLGIEGEGAALYFSAFTNLLAEGAKLPFAFERRSRRPPADPINASLSLAYALLTRTMTTTLTTVGLDPWLGLYHCERPGRPSLALDFMEPYRPLLADSAVLMAINNGEIGPDDFVHAAGGCNLTPKGRRALIKAYERRLDVVSTHPVFGYRISMRRMIAVQARLLARWLMGEIEEYPHVTPR